MKNIFYILFLISLAACKTISPLNKELDSASRIAVAGSPFASASKTLINLDKQRNSRQLYLDEITKMRSAQPQDTIVLTEFYEENCGSCQAKYVDIQTPRSIKLYDKTANGTYILKKEVTLGSRQSEFEMYTFQVKEIFALLRTGKDWNKDPRHYGDDKCKEGNHSFYTVFFPDGKVQSMYVRCWTLRPGGGKW